ncbi:hypothetical protein PM085_18750 [Halorubrum ezzemoulense]|uniref:Uncharacterized protein n=1 Tax=Halorubrum ezzemoulense TaxID=337243 RepID=A0ABT4Z7W4_HALEZ|nr:hypothetical protein [Halorubrum ezzemoulense]MDB2294253.1 hypothetical protein [Halorubrum ezzemoulense]
MIDWLFVVGMAVYSTIVFCVGFLSGLWTAAGIEAGLFDEFDGDEDA